MKFKVLTYLLSILTLSYSLTFKSSLIIHQHGGKIKGQMYYDDTEKLIGFRYKEPIIMDTLQDFKTNLLYKKGYYYDDTEYYTDYFEFSDSSETEENETDSELDLSSDLDLSSESEYILDSFITKTQTQQYQEKTKREISSSSSFEAEIDPKLKYKKEITYNFIDFQSLNSLNIPGSVELDTISVDNLTKNIERPYLTDDIQKLIVYNKPWKDIEYIYYLNNNPVEYKFKDAVYVLYNHTYTTTEEIKEIFEIESKDFSRITPKCTNEIDIVFLLDESGQIAESEFNKMIEFCKSIVKHYTVKYSKSRFALVGYGSFGVK